jgi:hypothetical protein
VVVGWTVVGWTVVGCVVDVVGAVLAAVGGTVGDGGSVVVEVVPGSAVVDGVDGSIVAVVGEDVTLVPTTVETEDVERVVVLGETRGTVEPIVESALVLVDFVRVAMPPAALMNPRADAAITIGVACRSSQDGAVCFGVEKTSGSWSAACSSAAPYDRS